MPYRTIGKVKETAEVSHNKNYQSINISKVNDRLGDRKESRLSRLEVRATSSSRPSFNLRG